MIAAVLVLALACQDDVARLLENLRSDEFAERESAQRALERMGPQVLGRLQAELDKVGELDTKLRLKTLIERIPRLAKLAMVYGPTKRVSISARNEKLGDVFRKMEAALGEKLLGEGVDLAPHAQIPADRQHDDHPEQQRHDQLAREPHGGAPLMHPLRPRFARDHRGNPRVRPGPSAPRGAPPPTTATTAARGAPSKLPSLVSRLTIQPE